MPKTTMRAPAGSSHGSGCSEVIHRGSQAWRGVKLSEDMKATDSHLRSAGSDRNFCYSEIANVQEE